MNTIPNDLFFLLVLIALWSTSGLVAFIWHFTWGYRTGLYKVKIFELCGAILVALFAGPVNFFIAARASFAAAELEREFWNECLFGLRWADTPKNRRLYREDKIETSDFDPA